MSSAPWNEDGIVELIGKILADSAAACDLENAPRGIDGLTEGALQRCICAGLNDPTIVARKEARYPDARFIELLNHGQRCDLLLHRTDEDFHSPPGTNADKAGSWLEIKRVAQFLDSGPNWHYERTLLETLPADIFKLANDPAIFHAGLLVILFARNTQTGTRDLHTWKYLALERGCPVGVPRIYDFPITNRIGNEHTTVGLFPMRRL